MPPNGFTKVKSSSEEESNITYETYTNKTTNSMETTPEVYKPVLIWRNIIKITLLHMVAVIFLLKWSLVTKLYTYLWGYLLILVGAFGITGGAHRLWSHRSYKAKWPLRLLLMLCFSAAGENSIYDWVRDHRVHHKYSETDADPQNSKRGFFFSHVGWLMQKKHPEVLKKGEAIDMSDILADPIVLIHQKHFATLKTLLCFVIPILVPYYFWNESFVVSLMAIGCLRYVLLLNINWLVNSAAHIWGYRPYDKRINPTENLTVAILALGEGWHNYHHVFPWDYKAAELGDYKFNLTTLGLDMFQKIGWAYDMKQPSKELIERVCEKYGDGSHPHCPPHEVDENGKVTNWCEQ